MYSRGSPAIVHGEHDPDEIALLLTLVAAVSFLAAVTALALLVVVIGEPMQTATLLRLLENAGSADDPDQADAFGRMPELPSLSKRWTVRRKAAVIEAVRGGWVPIEKACRLYNLSVDEFLAWERDIDRHGMHGLRTTRYQVYRDTEAQKR